MIKSEKLYSPQSYLRLVTGKTFVIDGDNDVESIELILEQEGYDLWSYAFTEIEHIVENKISVVLVDCLVYNEKTEEFDRVFRWFEVDLEEDEELYDQN